MACRCGRRRRGRALLEVPFGCKPERNKLHSQAAARLCGLAPRRSKRPNYPNRSICAGWSGSICNVGVAGGFAQFRVLVEKHWACHVRGDYGANISCRTARTAVRVPGAIRASRFTRRWLSTVRSWSIATNPARSRNRQRTRHGYACPPVVIGATMTVRRCWFSSSGDITRQGRVFLISLPRVGSRSIR
jgi:hypothetical protein